MGGRMNPRRLIAAVAAVASVLILQAGLITPLTAPLAVSLPAVFVAAVSLNAGVSTGMSIGFVTGLVADLGSEHPAGVLALCWLGLGLACGIVADSSRRTRVSLLIVTIASGLASVAASALLDAVGSASVGPVDVLRLAVPTTVVDGGLALLIFAAVRAVLRTDGVRAPRRPRPLVFGPLPFGLRRGGRPLRNRVSSDA